MRRGINSPVSDLAPQPWERDEPWGLVQSHVKLMTIHAARRFFMAQRVRVRTETMRTYAISLQLTGNIQEQEEQDDSMVGSIAKQDDDAGNRS